MPYCYMTVTQSEIQIGTFCLIKNVAMYVPNMDRPQHVLEIRYKVKLSRTCRKATERA
jgi:hypothetical protein